MKPILFNTEMVRAILDGRKTTTRRIIKPQPIPAMNVSDGIIGATTAYWGNDQIRNLPYQIDDILYVRETFYQYGEWYDTQELIHDEIYGEIEKDKHSFLPRVDSRFPIYFINDIPKGTKILKSRKDGKGYYKRPSIFMPKEAARIFLHVTNVRAERIQDITNEQAIAEGAKGKEDFMWIWDSTIKKSELSKYGWDANPWVWVIEFERCEKERGA